jgi:hypothetical protein
MIVSVFLPLGPCGQGAYGLLQLAKVVRQLSQENQLADGELYSADELRTMASAIYGCSIMYVTFHIHSRSWLSFLSDNSAPNSGGLVIWGVGLFWLVVWGSRREIAIFFLVLTTVR